METIPVLAGCHTDRGRRSSNQDSVVAAFLPDGRELVAVADGMGGHCAGEVASQRALETFYAGLTAGTPLLEAVHAANAAVYAAGCENPQWVGMGTTLVALLRTGDHYQIVNVGDSRAYRVLPAGVQQITTDHSFRAEALSNGQLSAEETLRSRWRNALTRAVGTEAEVEVDIFGPFDAEEPHVVVLCSDGVHGTIADDDLWRCVGETTDPHMAAHRLVEAAYRNGSSDNISAAVVAFGGTASQAAATGSAEVPRADTPTLAPALRGPGSLTYAAILPEYVHTHGPPRSFWQRLREWRSGRDATNTAAFICIVAVMTLVVLLLRSLM